MLQRLRERLAIILIGLLPFHAFLVTVLTNVILGPDHPPMGIVAVWKEGLLGVILMVAIIEMVQGIRAQWSAEGSASPFRVDYLDLLIVVLLILSLALLPFSGQGIGLYLIGFKYDFIPLVAFLVLRRVAWSDWWKAAAMRVVVLVAAVIASYGLLTLVLPHAFFRFLGYADQHSLYFADGPLAAFQQIGGSAIRRMQSTMSGPNQLGMWLLVPWSVLLVLLARGKVESGKWKVNAHSPLSTFHFPLSTPLIVTVVALHAVGLLLTFSRAAWIAAAVMVLAALWGAGVHRRLGRRVMGGGVVLLALCVMTGAMLFPDVLLRFGSSRAHLERPVEAVQRMINHPLGMGLGMAGPASNRVRDACVFLRAEDDPSWAASFPNLCVFLGDVQVQPRDRACECPFLPENWYLQIGVEMGWAGMILFVLLIGRLLWMLRRNRGQSAAGDDLRYALFLALLGVSIGALFLHAWEDAAVAYTLWLLAAASIPSGLPDPEPHTVG